MAGERERDFYVVAYDIPDDRRRSKVYRTLCGFGTWTQYSLFECFLTRKEMVVLRSRLDHHLEPEEDSVRFYPLCRGCLKRVESVGLAQPEEPVAYLL